uniref:Spire type actin nucleation factor 2 n=1 Tax=Cairina moschata TaxID=8855 RepID=A0A8C3BQ44_CAIMO
MPKQQCTTLPAAGVLPAFAPRPLPEDAARRHPRNAASGPPCSGAQVAGFQPLVSLQPPSKLAAHRDVGWPLRSSWLPCLGSEADRPSRWQESFHTTQPRGGLSLEEVLKCYEQPLNEEQAWALCFQGCRAAAAAPAAPPRTADILLRADGTVGLPAPPSSCWQMVQSLGFAIYRALDWGLDENEERELSPQLEQLIDLMTNSDSEDSGCGTADEGYGGQEEEEEGGEGPPRAVRTFGQAMRCCAARLADPAEAQAHYQAVCRALFAETVELKAFLAKIHDAKEMLHKLNEDEEAKERPSAELGSLRNTDWARLWVQLMRELRHGVKLKKVQEKQFNPLPTEYQLTPFEMLMQDIRARNYKLRKVMVDGDIPPRVKKDAHELILDFIRSRPPLKQASERRLRPLPQKQRTLHEKILEEIKQERKLRPVETQYRGQKGYSSLPCIPHACSSHLTSSSCIDLSTPEASTVPPRPRPRVLLKAPTLAEMEEMNISEEEDSPGTEPGLGLPMKRDRSFSEQDLAQFQSELSSSQAAPEVLGPLEPEPRPRSGTCALWPPQKPSPHSPARGARCVGTPWGTPRWAPCARAGVTAPLCPQEFSHPVESLALTVEEMINVRRVLVKAEMEKFQQSKELYNSLKKGKVCCCCRTKFPLFSWPSACLFCKRSVCTSCSLKMKMPSKKLAHIPVYALGFESLPGSLLAKALPLRRRETFHSLQGPGWRCVEEEFPHIYAQGSVLRDVCSDCSGFVTDVVCSSRRSVAVLNAAPHRAARCESWYK